MYVRVFVTGLCEKFSDDFREVVCGYGLLSWETHYILGLIPLKMADWQPFWISVILSDCYLGGGMSSTEVVSWKHYIVTAYQFLQHDFVGLPCIATLGRRGSYRMVGLISCVSAYIGARP